MYYKSKTFANISTENHPRVAVVSTLFRHLSSYFTDHGHARITTTFFFQTTDYRYWQNLIAYEVGESGLSHNSAALSYGRLDNKNPQSVLTNVTIYMQPKMISGVVWIKLLLILFEFLEMSLKQETLISNLLNYTTTQNGVAFCLLVGLTLAELLTGWLVSYWMVYWVTRMQLNCLLGDLTPSFCSSWSV